MATKETKGADSGQRKAAETTPAVDPMKDAANDPTLIEEARAAEQARKDREAEAAAAANAPAGSGFDDIPDDDRPTEWCYVPQWGTKWLVQAMSREQRDALERDFTKESVDDVGESTTTVERMGFVTAVVQLTVVHPTERDEDGDRKRVFVGPEAKKKLQKKNAEALAVLYDVGARLSGLRKADREKIVGNSAGVRGTTSSTASPSTVSA